MSVPKQAIQQLEEVEKALDNKDTSQLVDNVEAKVQDHNELPDQQGLDNKVNPKVEELTKELELEKQRTASLKGRIDSQLTKANSENKELKKQLEDLTSSVDAMKRENAVPGFKRKLTEEEIENVGEEVLELQDRVIRGTIEEELESGSIKRKVNQIIEDSIKARQEQRKQNQTPSIDQSWFWDQVENYYPGAKQLNTNDQGWFNFLEKYDSHTGQQYRSIGAKAINDGDIPGLVDLLKLYKPISDQEVIPEEYNVSVKPETTGSGNTLVTAPVDKVFTQAEVKKLYNDKARGKFKGNAKDWAQLEEQIMEAAASGRIL